MSDSTDANPERARQSHAPEHPISFASETYPFHRADPRQEVHATYAIHFDTSATATPSSSHDAETAARDEGIPPLQVVPILSPGISCTSGCAADAVVGIEVLRYDVDDLYLCPACLATLQEGLQALRNVQP
jgi:hypothetical protein